MAGLDCGLAGGAAFIAWMLVHSWIRGEFWWSKLNVAGALFFGGSVYSMGRGWATLAGASLLLVLYASLGALFALIASTRGVARNLILGLLLALSFHLVADRFLWRRFDPFAPAYFPPLATLPGHMLYGLSLVRFSRRFSALSGAFGPPAPAAEFHSDHATSSEADC
ncbi:MAG: hypothetical protein HY858_11665 [Candidatus Solibacter usitatus]|nr:hypothetical protein [Candidatus Solibacter usitatus]